MTEQMQDIYRAYERRHVRWIVDAPPGDVSGLFYRILPEEYLYPTTNRRTP